MSLEALVLSLASGVQPLIRMIIAIALIVGLLGSIAFLVRARKVAQHSVAGMGMGRIFAGILFSCCLISLRSFMNSGAHSLGFGDVTFDQVTYASQSMYGVGASVVNSILSILRAVGVYFFYKGAKGLKDSQLEGHTELSSSGMIGKSIIKMICGLCLIFNPEIIKMLISMSS